MALPVLNQAQLPNLRGGSDCLPNSDDVLARYVEIDGVNGSIQRIAIGYFKDQQYMNWGWAFAPFANGNVPTIKGSELDSWVTTVIKGSSLWTRNHMQADYKKSGDDGLYCWSRDKNGRHFVLIPANGQDGFVGYVPARHVDTSLNNGYLTDPRNYCLIADNRAALHLACRGVPYANHGFNLHGQVWWPVKNPPFANSAAQINALAARIDDQIQRHFLPLPIQAPIPVLRLPAAMQFSPPSSPAATNATLESANTNNDDESFEETEARDEPPNLLTAQEAVVEHFPHAQNFDDLPIIERARAQTIKDSCAEIVNAQEGLGPYQKVAVIRDLERRIDQLAMERFYVNEPANHVMRGIEIQIPPEPPTICQTVTRSTMSGVTVGLASSQPLIALFVGTTIFFSTQLFDEECCLNKILRSLGL